MSSRIEINPEALRELLLSPAMENALMSFADGYEGDRRAWRSGDRVAIQIYRDNNDGNRMLKELFKNES